MELLEIIDKNISQSQNIKRANADNIYEALSDYIKSNQLSNKRLPAISELAKSFGANYRTVKSALLKLEKNGLISYESNVGKVSNRMLELCYVRWGVDAFCSTMCDGIKRYCDSQDNLDLIIIDAHMNHSKVIDGLLSISDVVDGLLLMPFELPEYYKVIGDLMSRNKKVVMLDRILHNVNASSVTVDDFGGAYQAVSHLLRQHKQPVLYFGNSVTPSTSHNRYIGWLEAMKEHGHFDIDDYCIDIRITESDSKVSQSNAAQAEIDAADSIFEHTEFDKFVIFASNDLFATRVYNSAEKRGLQVGRDVFVVGFGNTPVCENLKVSLSSVEQSIKKLGFEGAKLLHAQLTGELNGPVHRLLPANLVIRQSSVAAVLQQVC